MLFKRICRLPLEWKPHSVKLRRTSPWAALMGGIVFCPTVDRDAVFMMQRNAQDTLGPLEGRCVGVWLGSSTLVWLTSHSTSLWEAGAVCFAANKWLTLILPSRINASTGRPKEVPLALLSIPFTTTLGCGDHECQLVNNGQRPA